MKGISLSINAMILIVLAVIVLAVMIASFVNSIRNSGENVDCQAKLQSGCNLFLMAGGCESDFSGELPSQLKDGLECSGWTATTDNAKKVCCK